MSITIPTTSIAARVREGFGIEDALRQTMAPSISVALLEIETTVFRVGT